MVKLLQMKWNKQLNTGIHSSTTMGSHLLLHDTGLECKWKTTLAVDFSGWFPGLGVRGPIRISLLQKNALDSEKID